MKLTKKSQVILAQKDDNARRELIASVLDYLLAVAHRCGDCYGGGQDRQDCIWYASESIDAFEPARKVPFDVYAGCVVAYAVTEEQAKRRFWGIDDTMCSVTDYDAVLVYRDVVERVRHDQA